MNVENNLFNIAEIHEIKCFFFFSFMFRANCSYVIVLIALPSTTLIMLTELWLTVEDEPKDDEASSLFEIRFLFVPDKLTAAAAAVTTAATAAAVAVAFSVWTIDHTAFTPTHSPHPTTFTPPPAHWIWMVFGRFPLGQTGHLRESFFLI